MRYYVITAKIVKQVDGNMQEREKKKVAFVNNQREAVNLAQKANWTDEGDLFHNLVDCHEVSFLEYKELKQEWGRL